MDKIENNESVWQEIERSGRVGEHKIMFYDSVDSTNALAMSLGLDNSVNAGTVLVAKTQTKGRGRLGKSWVSPAETGLYFSIVLRPELSREDLAKITLGVGLGVSKAVESLVGVSAMIKWPNDVLIDGKKVAGVLTESGSWSGTDRPLVVVGVGVNVNTQVSVMIPDLCDTASSLFEITDKIYDKGIVLEMILEKIDAEVTRLEGGGFAELLAEWRKKDVTFSKRLTWVTSGGKTVSGVSLGPDQEGLLRVQDDSGVIHEVLSGDLTLAHN